MNIVTAPRRSESDDRKKAVTSTISGTPSLLVAIASHGSGQDHFLERLIREYRTLDAAVRIVVLSNVPKTVSGAEVLVGVPTRDPWSLPFAHRQLFADNADRYDLFIYSENDTLITAKNLSAFLSIQGELQDDEILGFMRSETDPSGRRYIVSANNHFRWLPHTVVTRGQYKFAQFSNDHAGCFVATRRQLKRAMASGGFLVPPHANPYDMLVSAASDIYTQCGFRRLICLSRIDEFILPHLANKYYSRIGVSADDFKDSVQHLAAMTERSEAGESLFDPRTRARDFRWSKNLYRQVDSDVIALLPSSCRRVLSVGAASGENELALRDRGVEVVALAIDSVFGYLLRRRGIEAFSGRLPDIAAELPHERFDAIFLPEVLHLVCDPASFLSGLTGLLAPGGVVVGSVSNTNGALWPLRDLRHGRWRLTRPSFAAVGAHPMSPAVLRQICRAACLSEPEVWPAIEESNAVVRRFLNRVAAVAIAPRLLFRAAATTT